MIHDHMDGHMDRRAMLQSLALLIGAAALPSDALAQSARRRGRRFLNRGRFATLIAIADTMVPVTDTPGALAAAVPEKIDGLLRNWASPARRTALVGAIATLDARAVAAHGTGLTALTPEQRKAVILAYEPEALRAVPRADGLGGFAAMLAGPAVADPGYAKLKELIVVTYYMSEIAMTQELIYTHVPGGYTPSVPVTPETRPHAGGGLFG
jgi:gluconate 2-dehydrogenase gamma chain